MKRSTIVGACSKDQLTGKSAVAEETPHALANFGAIVAGKSATSEEKANVESWAIMGTPSAHSLPRNLTQMASRLSARQGGDHISSL